MSRPWPMEHRYQWHCTCGAKGRPIPRRWCSTSGATQHKKKFHNNDPKFRIDIKEVTKK